MMLPVAALRSQRLLLTLTQSVPSCSRSRRIVKNDRNFGSCTSSLNATTTTTTATSTTTASNVRVRFAPSPTGLLHLGGFRTALLNYLFAVKHNGTFILRIEDTDQTRIVPEGIKMIEEDLNWLGLIPHEGPSNPGTRGPYIQSQRLRVYEDSIKTLIDAGAAYECFCSETRIDLMRREALKQRQRPRYDNKCRDLTREQVKAKKVAGEKYCIRFKLQPEIIEFNDLVYGPVKFDLKEGNYEGDHIIIKTDGFPTYHFANVVDDHFMKISHVLRGIEWQVSTPKHLQMYRAFGWKPPQFAHLPLIVNKDGTKLSKRQGDISIRHYKEKTYYPLALTNFVTKSGGGFDDHNVDRLYSMDQLSKLFDLSKVNTADCRLDFTLLSLLNQLELKNQINYNLESVLFSLKCNLPSATKNSDNLSNDYLEKVIKWSPERISTICDLLDPKFSYLWSQPGPESVLKINLSPDRLVDFSHEFEKYLSSTGVQGVKDKSGMSLFIQDYASKNQINFKKLMRDIRLALCGVEAGPPIADILELFGKETFLTRLRDASSLRKIEETEESVNQ